MSTLAAFTDFLEKISNIIIGILVAIITTTVFIQVVYRILGLSIPWTDEVARFSFIWLVFIGASVQVKNNAHFSVTIIKDRIKNHKYLDIFVYTAMLILGFVLLIYGKEYALMGLGRVSPVMHIRMIWIYAAIPVGGLLMIIYIIEKLLHSII